MILAVFSAFLQVENVHSKQNLVGKTSILPINLMGPILQSGTGYIGQAFVISFSTV